MVISGNTLCIFVTSDRPDVYVNTIGHCIDHYRVDRILFLSVVRDRGRREITMDFLKTVRDRVKSQLDALSEGQYLCRDEKDRKWRKKNIQLDSGDRRRYSRMAECRIDTELIFYDGLETRLADLAAGACIFDVTAVLKQFLIDIYGILSSRGAREIRVFELKGAERSFDEKELIHNLSLDDGGYEYVNLTDSRYTASLTTLTKEAVQELGVQMETIASRAATRLAVWWMLVLALVSSASTVLVFAVIRQVGWDRIEPFTLVMVPLQYAAACILVSIGKEQIPFRPRALFRAFQRREHNRLLNLVPRSSLHE
jgi:hypothetical protein